MASQQQRLEQASFEPPPRGGLSGDSKIWVINIFQKFSKKSPDKKGRGSNPPPSGEGTDRKTKPGPESPSTDGTPQMSNEGSRVAWSPISGRGGVRDIHKNQEIHKTKMYNALIN